MSWQIRKGLLRVGKAEADRHRVKLQIGKATTVHQCAVRTGSCRAFDSFDQI